MAAPARQLTAPGMANMLCARQEIHYCTTSDGIRVAYRLDQDGLWRDHWQVLDRPQATEPLHTKLLTGIRGVSFRFLAPSRTWSERWPVGTSVGPATSDAERARPAAIEVTLDLEDWGEIKRLVEVSG